MTTKNIFLKFLLSTTVLLLPLISACSHDTINPNYFDVKFNIFTAKDCVISNTKASVYSEFCADITFDSTKYLYKSIEIFCGQKKLINNTHFLIINTSNQIKIKIFNYSILKNDVVINLSFDEIKILPSDFLVIEDGTILAGLQNGADLLNYNTLLIPSFITTIKDKAFSYKFNSNTKIVNLVFSKNSSLKIIGEAAFERCTNLSNKLIFPESLFMIKDSAFHSCTGLKSELVFTNNVREVGSNAFYGCSNLTSISFSDSVEIIGDYAFYECSNLRGNLFLPNSLRRIGNYAFYNCSNIDGEIDMKMMEHCSYIGDYAFANCNNICGDIFLSHEITYLGQGAFMNCYNISGNVVVPDQLTKIYNDTFLNCYSLDDGLTFGSNSSLEEIGDNAFCNTSILCDLDLPPKLKIIGANAFKNCARLSGIKFNGSVNIIKESAFQNCTSLSTVLEIPDSVEEIDDLAFAGCNHLIGDIKLPLNCKYVGYSAFRGCKSFEKSVSISTDITNIHPYTFKDCSSIKKIDVLSESLRSIEYSAFEGCTSLTDLIIPDNMNNFETIAENAFKNCTSLEHIKNIQWCKRICDYAFFNCKKLIGNGPDATDEDKLTLCAKSIGENAFSSCESINYINLVPYFDEIKIKKNAFKGCENIKKIYFGGIRQNDGNTNYETRPIDLDPLSFPDCKNLIELHFENWNQQPIWAGQSHKIFSAAANNEGKIFAPEGECAKFWERCKQNLGLNNWKVIAV